jgi:tight adherence protein B
VTLDDQIQVIASLAAFGVLALFAGLATWYNRKQEIGRLRSHVASHLAGAPGTDPAAARAEVSSLTSRMNRRIGSTSLAQQLQIQLVRSGLGISPNQLMLMQLGAACLLFVLGRFLLAEELGPLAVLVGLVMTLPAIFLPRFVLKWLEKRRISKYEVQLAQAVDIMAGALQAGSSLPQSFGLVAREMPDPIGLEFGRVMSERTLGVTLENTLIHMLDRVQSLDLDMLVTAINIQYKVGGNLSHILRTIAHTIRERVRIKGELSTLTAQARLSSYIIAGMPVVVVLALFVVSPSYIIKLFDPGITRVMLISGILGIIAGFYIMKRIAAIEV